MARNPTIRPLRDSEVRSSLAAELVGIVDEARQLATDFGLRPMRVFLVWLAWDRDVDGDGIVRGEEEGLDVGVGVGTARVALELEILPTPRVRGTARRGLPVGGVTEDGELFVDRISASFSEDLLVGLHPEMRDPARPEQLRPGIEFFWEVTEHRPVGHRDRGTVGGDAPLDAPPLRRRYRVAEVPELRRGKIDWVVRLSKADGERGRDGAPEAGA